MLTRRLFAASLAAAGAGACTTTGSLAVAPPAVSHSGRPPLKLAKVWVNEDRITRTVVGLRPYRPEGFVVRADKLGDKMLVHNYGHGGGGVTLSWGTSELAVPLGFAGPDRKYAVLGCGAVGLATARLLQERGGKVTIYADKLPPDTTSNIAGAQWWPYLVYDHEKINDAFKDQFVQAANLAYRRYQTMLSPHYGVAWRRNFTLRDAPQPQAQLAGASGPLKGLAPEALNLAPGEHPFGNYWLQQFDAMHIEPPIYLHAVMMDFFAAGGQIEVRRFETPDQVTALSEPVVYNCTGLGAGKLFNDPGIMPVKGQLIVLLPQPEVDYNLMSGDCYMFPRHDGIMLGGTHEEGVWDMSVNEEAKARIFAAQQALFAKMTG
ncbi:MAG TPA: FAD-dependent oxidoreductase [Caulobacteraceae bacterium]|jgi:glycine/D-amino acid oxidase-like deaminating enzyme|nr:FAD-dependent oxidoreductase [Caulobacteraceae bacterium]